VDRQILLRLRLVADTKCRGLVYATIGRAATCREWRILDRALAKGDLDRGSA
jgi:hypothetical protein